MLMENILKIELLENSEVTIIMLFPCLNLSQAQIQNGW